MTIELIKKSLKEESFGKLISFGQNGATMSLYQVERQTKTRPCQYSPTISTPFIKTSS